MAAGAKPWSALLPAATLLVLAVALVAAKSAAAAAPPYDDGVSACSKDHLPPECGADVFKNCNRVPFPFNLIWRSCRLEERVKNCCDALKQMKDQRHRCAKCALLKEAAAVPKFDPAQCTNGVQSAAANCEYCEQNPTDEARCKDA